MGEISSDDGLIEVGYSNNNRYVLVPASAPVDETGSAAISIDSSWVILVTGGARGITADVTVDLARRYQPTLLLVGRSALPDSEESPETAGLTAPQELKAAIMERMKKDDQEVSPAKVEAVYSRLLKDREMRENIAKMRSAGAKVHYYQADVRDEHGFSNLINEIYQTYGRLDGVIHGAGIIEDKLVRDKTPESFDRVFDTKVNSAFILSRELRAESLSFFVIFSSVAGRFGNRGQSDYAAANEVYCKLAVYLDKIWPGRVVSVIWGPWARPGGMVSDELEKAFAKRGIQLVPSSVGPRKLDEELRYGREGDVEVILGGGGWDARFAARPTGMVSSTHYPVSGTQYPLIGNSDSFSRKPDGTIQLIRTLDIARDIYLNDHRLDGKPVLPMAMAMELMGEVASLGWPNLKVSEISDLHSLQGIVLENGQLDIQVTASPVGKTVENADSGMQVEVSLSSVDGSQRAYYRGKYRLEKELPPPVSQMSIYLEEERPFPMEVQDAYHQLLFQGPTFHGISEIEGMGSNGILARVNPSFPGECLAGMSEELARSRWIMDPVIIDSAFQLIILWTRVNLGITPLPTRALSFRRFGEMSDQEIECQIHIQTGSVSNVLTNKVVFFGENGHLLGLMGGLEFVGSTALDRLSAKSE